MAKQTKIAQRNLRKNSDRLTKEMKISDHQTRGKSQFGDLNRKEKRALNRVAQVTKESFAIKGNNHAAKKNKPVKADSLPRHHQERVHKNRSAKKAIPQSRGVVNTVLSSANTTPLLLLLMVTGAAAAEATRDVRTRDTRSRVRRSDEWAKKCTNLLLASVAKEHSVSRHNVTVSAQSIAPQSAWDNFANNHVGQPSVNVTEFAITQGQLFNATVNGDAVRTNQPFVCHNVIQPQQGQRVEGSNVYYVNTRFLPGTSSNTLDANLQNTTAVSVYLPNLHNSQLDNANFVNADHSGELTITNTSISGAKLGINPSYPATTLCNVTADQPTSITLQHKTSEAQPFIAYVDSKLSGLDERVLDKRGNPVSNTAHLFSNTIITDYATTSAQKTADGTTQLIAEANGRTSISFAGEDAQAEVELIEGEGHCEFALRLQYELVNQQCESSIKEDSERNGQLHALCGLDAKNGMTVLTGYQGPEVVFNQPLPMDDSDMSDDNVSSVPPVPSSVPTPPPAMVTKPSKPTPVPTPVVPVDMKPSNPTPAPVVVPTPTPNPAPAPQKMDETDFQETDWSTPLPIDDDTDLDTDAVGMQPSNPTPAPVPTPEKNW